MKNYQKLWVYANKIIPGGNGLLSKRPQRFSPKLWPTYFSKAKGIYIWDLNNKKYIDMSIMGIGTAILGYANDNVDNFVKKKISNGINTSLNSLEEIELAKKILEVDKFADQVKFARSGGEAVAIAIRIARSKNKRTKIAFSGYHGWHDWYLAANLKNKKNLNNHLLKDLHPLGVPNELKGSSIPIIFNDIKDLKRKIETNNISAIIIEPGRFNLMTNEFVKSINNVCKRKNICLIVDEITCGWRTVLGGLYKKIGLKPDIVVYGKAIGNGYAISAIVGKKKYMNMSNKSFISSTAWTETVGFSAAIQTINELKKKKFKNLENIGKKIIHSWDKSAKENNLKITTNKYYSIPSFQFNYGGKNDELYTLFTELYLKKNILASNSVYLSFSHNAKNIKKYIENINYVFREIRKFLKKKKKLNKNQIRRFNY
tara:strand:- start:52 stop:1338 length:1287 start_codon:yes stop_codon:yes gene_type:complete